MTLENRTGVYAAAALTDEQGRRVADALEDAQSENTRENYAAQLRRSGSGVAAKALHLYRHHCRS